MREALSILVLLLQTVGIGVVIYLSTRLLLFLSVDVLAVLFMKRPRRSFKERAFIILWRHELFCLWNSYRDESMVWKSLETDFSTAMMHRVVESITLFNELVQRHLKMREELSSLGFRRIRGAYVRVVYESNDRVVLQYVWTFRRPYICIVSIPRRELDCCLLTSLSSIYRVEKGTLIESLVSLESREDEWRIYGIDSIDRRVTPAFRDKMIQIEHSHALLARIEEAD